MFFQDVSERKRAERGETRPLSRPRVAGPRRGRGAKEDQPGAARPRGALDGDGAPEPGALRGPQGALPRRGHPQAGARQGDDEDRSKVHPRPLHDAAQRGRGRPRAGHLAPHSTAVPPDMRTEVSVQGDSSLLPEGMRDQLFLVLREGVRNAVSHAKAGRIKVAAEITPEKILGSVEDDGCGFDPIGDACASRRWAQVRAGADGARRRLLAPRKRPGRQHADRGNRSPFATGLGWRTAPR